MGPIPALDSEVLRAAAVVVRVPLRMPFRGVTARTGILLAGPAGWGEFAPFDEYGADESSRWLQAAVEAAFVGWPRPVRTRVGVNAIVPAVTPEVAEALAAAAVAHGSRTIKVKVAEPGGSLETDADRLAAVRSACGADVALRIDANAAWTVPEATAAVRRLDQIAGGLQYAEQPCATLAELADLRRRVSVPIAADESIRRADDPIRAVAAGAVDVLVIKAPPLGGVRAALEVVRQAEVPVVVSGAMDTSVGLAAGLALAAALPTCDLDCGLGTGALLADDVTATPLLAQHGAFAVVTSHTGHLLAPQPDPAALARAAGRVSEVERRGWLERMDAAWEAGAARRVAALVAHSQM
jgi:O-succinylbenzoate synthase